MTNTAAFLISRTIGSTSIQMNDARRCIFHSERMAQLSPTEYKILKLLLDSSIVSDTTIAYEVKGSVNDKWNETLEKHIGNLRAKLAPLGIYIRRVVQIGYIVELCDVPLN